MYNIFCTGLAIGVASGPRRAPTLCVTQIKEGPLDWQFINIADQFIDPTVADAFAPENSCHEILQVGL